MLKSFIQRKFCSLLCDGWHPNHKYSLFGSIHKLYRHPKAVAVVSSGFYRKYTFAFGILSGISDFGVVLAAKILFFIGKESVGSTWQSIHSLLTL